MGDGKLRRIRLFSFDLAALDCGHGVWNRKLGRVEWNDLLSYGQEGCCVGMQQILLGREVSSFPELTTALTDRS